MFITLILFVAGLALLVAGAEFLVRGSSRLAARLGVPSVVIGLTVVAYGTSTPELIVSARSALSGQPDLALGNVIGSNIFNVLGILGLSAIVAPLVVGKELIWREVPIMIAASVAVLLLALDGRFSRADGLLCLAGLAAYTLAQVRSALRFPAGAPASPAAAPPAPVLRSALLIVSGLGLLVVGAQWLIDSAVALARGAGVSELVIGLTIVAAGTSFPELATSVMAAFRGERDIAVGNVVGSNIYNLLGVLGLTAVISPSGVGVPAAALTFDFPVLIATAVACMPIFLSGHRIARWEGGVFVFYYLAYALYVILDAKGHDALPAYSGVMMLFVIPLTLLTVGIAFRRASRPGGVA